MSRTLDPREIREFTLIATRHGTTVAAQWFGLAGTTAQKLRKAHDPTYRPRRGHPTTRQKTEAEPRRYCPCARCQSHFKIAALKDRQAAENVRTMPAGEWDDWWDQAACRGRNNRLWFPDPIVGTSYLTTRAEQWDRARAICATCPSAEPCLAYALEHHIPDGMFGGLTPPERREARRHLEATR